jgi:hypothetical protein
MARGANTCRSEPGSTDPQKYAGKHLLIFLLCDILPESRE